MKSTSAVKERSAGDILNKTQSFDRSCKVASDFSHNREEGIKEADGIAAFEELVKKMFNHYFLLEPIMRDRSNIKPAASSDDILNYDVIDDFSNDESATCLIDPENSLSTLAHATS